MSSWISVDNQAKETIIVIPGWAMDAELFRHIYPSYNLEILTRLTTESIRHIVGRCKRNPHIKTILGFSMGGYYAVDAALMFSQVTKVILCGVCPKYSKGSLENLKKAIKMDKKSVLKSFYQAVFSKQQQEEFKQIIERYIENLDTDYLITMLDELITKKVTIEMLRHIPSVEWVQGRHDKVIFNNKKFTLAIASESNVKLTMSPVGHWVF